jgi:hypothetical protein
MRDKIKVKKLKIVKLKSKKLKILFFFQKQKFHYKPACEVESVCDKNTFLSLRLAKGTVGV